MTSKKKKIFYIAYTAQPFKMWYTYINADSRNPGKVDFRRIVGKQSDLDRRNLSVFHFPPRPCCRRNKEKERKYTNGKWDHQNRIKGEGCQAVGACRRDRSIRTDIAGCNKGSHQRRARMRAYKWLPLWLRRMRFEMPDEVQLHLLEVIEKVAAKKREVAW